eukprot:CAMPEP_0172422780 /NCGR_PEP_ID=MMETSP1064-20121228/8905_1 /TAXON_ID=202472 /ORGANISM="Aulacoseira subarctica , Strain CCAP 1002/5" /LENGTH=74 /DNA_ID=CAMNT_0013163809 /DNA_START=197 /DNA_END=422 /DNA_ORIENTATION=-
MASNPEEEEDAEEENVSDDVQSYDEVNDLIGELDESCEEEDIDEQLSDEDSHTQPDELDASAAEIMRNPVLLAA